MAPLVRRTWAPRGETPVLYQRTRSRERVSVIAALSVPPRRLRVGLYFSVLPNENVTVIHLQRFLADLRRQLQRPLVVIWDRLPGHRARSLHQVLARSRRVHLVFLPPYAPELNPVEYLWSYLKRNPLANHPAADASSLAKTAKRHARSLRRRPSLLRALLRATPLFSRRR
jgi:transposase